MFAKVPSSRPESGHQLVDPFSRFLPAQFWDPRNPSCWKEFVPVKSKLVGRLSQFEPHPLSHLSPFAHFGPERPLPGVAPRGRPFPT